MASPPSKSRFLKLLRRSATSAQKTQARGIVDENALWLAHEKALSTIKLASEATQRIAATAAKQRAAFDVVSERARAAASRGPDLERTLSRVSDAFERLGLVALNTGLESARLGESAGKSLSLVSEEVRTMSERGLEAGRELGASLIELAREMSQLVSRFEETRNGSVEIGQDAAFASNNAIESERVLTDMGERLRKTTGNDPETLRAIARATEHARELVTALAALSGKAPRALLVGALRPVLEPLLRVVAEDDSEEAED